MRTTKQVLEKPVIGCPTIHWPNQKIRKDFYDYSSDYQFQTIITVHRSELIRAFDTSAVVFVNSPNSLSR